MFGLSTKEMLYKAILNASQNQIEAYKQDIKNNISLFEDSQNDKANETLIKVRRDTWT